MKRIKDPELFKKIKDFLTEYLPVIRAKSPNTIIAYRVTLNLYLLFIRNVYQKQLADIVKEDFNFKNILLYLDWLKAERNNTVSTRNQRLAQIRQFCRYLMAADILSFSEYSKIQEIAKEANPQKDEMEYLTIEQTKLILLQPDIKKKTGLRDKFFISLLYDSGCRNQEILDLKVGDFVEMRDNAELHVIGKGRKYRATPISKDVQELFHKYCRIYHPELNKDSFLFYTIRNNTVTQMSADNVARFMNKYEALAKICEPEIPHIHPHLFRHTRAMHLYLAGMPLPLVSEWLGHSQLETTLIYARATTDMKREAVEKISDAENTVFNKDEKFKYADNEDILKKLYGLA